MGSPVVAAERWEGQAAPAVCSRCVSDPPRYVVDKIFAASRESDSARVAAAVGVDGGKQPESPLL